MKTFLRQLFYGGNGELRDYESLVLHAWGSQLPETARQRLHAQLKRISLIQRTSNDKLVTFYDLKDKQYATWGADVLFPLTGLEVLVATVRLGGPEAEGAVEADIVLHRGRLSSIEFSRNPRGMGPLKVLETKVFRDPTVTEAVAGDVSHIDATLPADYFELLSTPTVAGAANCQLLNPSQIRTVVLPDRNYYAVADCPDGSALLIARGERDGALYRMNPEEEIPIRVAESLRDALRASRP
jgi:hypothetical protein